MQRSQKWNCQAVPFLRPYSGALWTCCIKVAEAQRFAQWSVFCVLVGLLRFASCDWCDSTQDYATVLYQFLFEAISPLAAYARLINQFIPICQHAPKHGERPGGSHGRKKGRATGRLFWAKSVLRRFSVPRIGSGDSCFVDDFFSCWGKRVHIGCCLNPVEGRFILLAFSQWPASIWMIVLNLWPLLAPFFPSNVWLSPGRLSAEKTIELCKFTELIQQQQ